MITLIITIIIALLLLPYISDLAWSIGDIAVTCFYDWLEAWKVFINKVFRKGDV